MNALLGTKLRYLLDYLEEFRELIEINYPAYLKDRLRRRAAERLIQLLVEVACDVAGIILSEKGIIVETYYQSFLRLGEEKIIPMRLAKTLAGSAGLRNRIIHEYGEYKDEIVFSNMRPLYNAFLKFYHAIKDYCEHDRIS